MAVTISDPWDGQTGMFADHVYEQDTPSHSRILGPDGSPLKYAKQAIGFDLSKRSNTTQEGK